MNRLVKMKVTFCFILLVICYIIYSSHAASNELGTPKDPKASLQIRNTFVRSRRSRQLSGFLRIPGIICYYAKFGQWPIYDKKLRQLVFQFSVNVFALSDDAIKLYCTQVFKFSRLFRPTSLVPRNAPTVMSVTQISRFTTTAPWSNRLPVIPIQPTVMSVTQTSRFTTTTQLPVVPTQPSTMTRTIPTQLTTTFRPIVASTTIQSFTTLTTTTTTQDPSGTGTGTGKRNF
jgi:hypothetical protein